MISFTHRHYVAPLILTILFLLERQITLLGCTGGGAHQPEERRGVNKKDANDIRSVSSQQTFMHVQSADDIHNFGPCPMPSEDEWLLNTVTWYVGGNIPKYLHKVILTTSGGFPEYVPGILEMMKDDKLRSEASKLDNWKGSIEEAHVSWKIRNPEYEIRYYNLHYCRLYLQRFFHPLFLRVFDCIEAFAGKSDLFRYLVVYREGGFYSDWKQLCLKDDLLDYISSSEDMDQPRWDIPALGDTNWYSAWDPHGMANAFFGAMPQSPILAEAIRLSLRNIQRRADLEPGANAFKMTGPGVLHEAVLKTARGLDGVRLGTYHHGTHQLFRYRNEIIIEHKCSKCGQDQSWSDGNNYNMKLKIGEYFCPDAPSLFLPGDNGTKTSLLHRQCVW
jgi:hypothetical protein